jgi:hypothetical protein
VEAHPIAGGARQVLDCALASDQLAETIEPAAVGRIISSSVSSSGSLAGPNSVRALTLSAKRSQMQGSPNHPFFSASLDQVATFSWQSAARS